MSDQDNPRPKPGAPLPTVVVGSNQAREDSGLNPLPAKPAVGTAVEQRRTLGGMSVPTASTSEVTVALGGPPPPPPRSTAGGTPPQTPVIAPPNAPTVHSQRARR